MGKKTLEQKAKEKMWELRSKEAVKVASELLVAKDSPYVGYIIQKWTQKETYSGGHERSIYMQVKKYDEDFKKSIVTLYENGKTQSELSREYGVSLSAISRWVRLYSKITTDDGEILTAKQVKALQKRLVQLEEENLILKKAIAIFTPLSNKD